MQVYDNLRNLLLHKNPAPFSNLVVKMIPKVFLFANNGFLPLRNKLPRKKILKSMYILYLYGIIFHSIITFLMAQIITNSKTQHRLETIVKVSIVKVIV